MNGYINHYQQNQYQQNAIMTASQEQILLMLYDGAIRFCKQAIAANEANNLQEKLGRISKVFAIVTEFSDSLNHAVGGNIAADLDALYQFMLRELGKARKDESGKHLKVVLDLLTDLRETWGEAVEIYRHEQAGAIHAAQAASPLQNAVPKMIKRISAAG